MNLTFWNLTLIFELLSHFLHSLYHALFKALTFFWDKVTLKAAGAGWFVVNAPNTHNSCGGFHFIAKIALQAELFAVLYCIQWAIANW